MQQSKGFLRISHIMFWQRLLGNYKSCYIFLMLTLLSGLSLPHGTILGQVGDYNGRVDRCVLTLTQLNTNQPFRQVTFSQFSTTHPHQVRDIYVVDTIYGANSVSVCNRLNFHDEQDIAYVQASPNFVTATLPSNLQSDAAFYGSCLDALEDYSPVPVSEYDRPGDGVTLYGQLNLVSNNVNSSIDLLLNHALSPHFDGTIIQPTSNLVLLTGLSHEGEHTSAFFSFPVSEIDSDEVALERLEQLEQQGFESLRSFYENHMPDEWEYVSNSYSPFGGTILFRHSNTDLSLGLSINGSRLQGQILIHAPPDIEIMGGGIQFGAAIETFGSLDIEEFIARRESEHWQEIADGEVRLTESSGVIVMQQNNLYEIVNYDELDAGLRVETVQGLSCGSGTYLPEWAKP